jgi:hypothetical protein
MAGVRLTMYSPGAGTRAALVVSRRTVWPKHTSKYFRTILKVRCDASCPSADTLLKECCEWACAQILGWSLCLVFPASMSIYMSPVAACNWLSWYTR